MQDGYKVTKIVTIPEEWEVRQLGSFGDFFKGKTIIKSEITESGIPCIRYGDIYVQFKFANVVTHFSAYINKETAKKGRRLFKGDIIFAGTGETQEDIGKCVAYTREDEAYAGGDLVVFRPKKDIGVDSEFLSFCLNNGEVAKRKSRLGQGLSIFHIYSGHLQTLEVPFPPLLEQKKITAILCTVDDVIEKTDTIIEETKQLKKGLMQKLYAEGIGHTRFKETKIGRLPKEWEVKRIGDFSKVRRGASPRPIADQRYFSKSGRGWIRIADVTSSNKKLRKTKQFLSELGVSKSVPVNPGDLIMSICATIGRPIIVDMKACIHDGFVQFYDFNSSIEIEYFYYLLQLLENHFVATGQAGTQKNLNTDIVRRTYVPVPQFEEQRFIAQLLSTVDDKIEKEGAFMTQLKQLKKGLMQVLLTGNIRVKV